MPLARLGLLRVEFLLKTDTVASRHTDDKNWQIETAVWPGNLAGFLHCALETRWRRFASGLFLHDFLNDFLNDFLYENLNLL